MSAAGPAWWRERSRHSTLFSRLVAAHRFGAAGHVDLGRCEKESVARCESSRSHFHPNRTMGSGWFRVKARHPGERLTVPPWSLLCRSATTAEGAAQVVDPQIRDLPRDEVAATVV